MTLHYGSEADLKGKSEAASFLPQMLMRGTAKHTQRQIEDTLAKLKSTVFIGASPMAGESSR